MKTFLYFQTVVVVAIVYFSDNRRKAYEYNDDAIVQLVIL